MGSSEQLSRTSHGSVPPFIHVSLATGEKHPADQISAQLKAKEIIFWGEVGASPGADQSRTVLWEQRQPRTQTVGHLSHHRNHMSALLFHGAYYDPNLIRERQIVLHSKSLPMNNFCLLVCLLFWFGENLSLCLRNQAKSLPSRSECVQMLAGQPQDKLGPDQPLLQPEQLIRLQRYKSRLCDSNLR